MIQFLTNSKCIVFLFLRVKMTCTVEVGH